MAHVLAGAFQQARRIRQLGATEKADIDVSFECVDIGKSGIGDARGRVAVMQQFAYIVSTVADHVEPMPRDSAQFTGMSVHPVSDRRVSPERAGEPKELRHGARSLEGFGVREVLSATAWRTRALKADASTSSPSWMSIARRTLPSRLELKRRAGSSRGAPLAKVSFTTFL